MTTATPFRLPILLASASPRRAALLEDAGYRVVPMPADLDDADLAPHEVEPSRWVVAMAWLKAARVQRRWRATDHAPHVLLAADTVCDIDGTIVGKPRDREDAERTLRRLVGRSHRVHTGVCALDLSTRRRRLMVDSATVTLGSLDDETLARYLESGEWEGKAGGYNFIERVRAGWPLDCDGDPTSVMGLPMTRLGSLLAPFTEPPT